MNNSDQWNISSEQALIGSSSVFRNLLRLVNRIAASHHTLLITGPTGSGKGVIAQHVHKNSNCAQHPFVDLNCGAIPEHLVESELFGHAKGAFTGADSNRDGYLHMVGKGTLFLDEIGELPLLLQPKLLRILESRTYSPIGSTKELHFAGRIIAATNRDLAAMAHEGSFREDLYYRLAVFVVDLPPLERRKEDIPKLIEYFSSRQPRKLSFTPEAILRICQQKWPGNIRQLRNLIDQIGVLAESPQISCDILDSFLSTDKTESSISDEILDKLIDLTSENKLIMLENMIIDRALQRCDNNKTAAARLLGSNRKHIERQLKTQKDSQQQSEMHLKKAQEMISNLNFAEAVKVLELGLKNLPKNNQSNSSLHLQFETYRMLGICYRNIHGWACSKALSSYQEAIKVGKNFCEPFDFASLQFGLWATQLMSLNLGKARATAQDMLFRAQNSNNKIALHDANIAMANTLFWLGDSEEALACLNRGKLINAGVSNEQIGSHGFDLFDLALTFEGLASFQIGAWSQARRSFDTLVQRAKNEQRQALNRVLSYQGAAWLACMFEEMHQLDELSLSLENLSHSNGFTFYRGIGQIFRGRYLSSQGNYAEAEKLLIGGFENYTLSEGGKLFHSFQAWHLGESLLDTGQLDSCHEIISRAINIALENQVRVYLSELLCIKAQVFLAQGERNKAEEGFRSALSTAQAIGSVPAHLNAATQLAKLLEQSQRREQARQILSYALHDNSERQTNCPCLQRALNIFEQLS